MASLPATPPPLQPPASMTRSLSNEEFRGNSVPATTSWPEGFAQKLWSIKKFWEALQFASKPGSLIDFSPNKKVLLVPSLMSVRETE